LLYNPNSLAPSVGVSEVSVSGGNLQQQFVCPQDIQSTSVNLSLEEANEFSGGSILENTEMRRNPSPNPTSAGIARPNVPLMTSAPGKRKASGPSSDITLPPLKKGGKRGRLSAQERQQRSDMRKKGASIMCRQKDQRYGPKLRQATLTNANLHCSAMVRSHVVPAGEIYRQDFGNILAPKLISSI
jgi:hypothetical protein